MAEGPGLQSRVGRLILLVAVLGLLIAAPAQASMFDVADKIMCQCGCNSVLSECPHQDCGWGIPAKTYIEEQLQAGKTEAEMVQYYVQQYGEKILAAPPKAGFNMMAWIIPFAGLIIGGGALYLVVRMWAQRRAGAEAVEALQPAPAPLPEDKARLLEDELKNFD
jgi:cytochrome c-type biogenesis protein CcmH